MASRAEQKARARAARLEAERSAAEAAARRKRLAALSAAGGLIMLVLAIGGIYAYSGSVSSSKTKTRESALRDIQLPGLISTAPPWPPETKELAARIDKLNLPSSGDESNHFHVLLTVFRDGDRVDVPSDIGVTASAMSPVHTHDKTGVIHIESGEQFPFRLADIFAIWGVAFTNQSLGDQRAYGAERVYVFVNGKKISDGEDYVLKPKDNIVVAYGRIGSFDTRVSSAPLDDV